MEQTEGQQHTDYERLKCEFNLCDTSKTGKITPESLATVMKRLGFSPCEEELQSFINDMDSNGDGCIHFDQFVNMMSRYKDDQQLELEEAFKTFDKDSSGKISFDELRKQLYSIGERLPDSEIRRILEEADKDGDGEINFEEFVKFVKESEKEKTEPEAE